MNIFMLQNRCSMVRFQSQTALEIGGRYSCGVSATAKVERIAERAKQYRPASTWHCMWKPFAFRKTTHIPTTNTSVMDHLLVNLRDCKSCCLRFEVSRLGRFTKPQRIIFIRGTTNENSAISAPRIFSLARKSSATISNNRWRPVWIPLCSMIQVVSLSCSPSTFGIQLGIWTENSMRTIGKINAKIKVVKASQTKPTIIFLRKGELSFRECRSAIAEVYSLEVPSQNRPNRVLNLLNLLDFWDSWISDKNKIGAEK